MMFCAMFDIDAVGDAAAAFIFSAAGYAGGVVCIHDEGGSGDDRLPLQDEGGHAVVVAHHHAHHRRVHDAHHAHHIRAHTRAHTRAGR